MSGGASADRAPTKGVEVIGPVEQDHAEAEPASPGEIPVEQAIGAEVSVGAPAPADAVEVAARDLLSSPEQYRGKRVVVSGRVKGFCHHARAWFAIDVPDGTPPFLRLVTLPAFHVPEGVMGAMARAHGTVEVVDVPTAQADHFATTHRLGPGSGSGSSGSVPSVVVRAEGAVVTPSAGSPSS